MHDAKGEAQNVRRFLFACPSRSMNGQSGTNGIAIKQLLNY